MNLSNQEPPKQERKETSRTAATKPKTERRTTHKKLLNFENFTSCNGSEKGTSKQRANHTQTAKRPENDNGHIIPKTRGESCRKSTPQPRQKPARTHTGKPGPKAAKHPKAHRTKKGPQAKKNPQNKIKAHSGRNTAPGKAEKLPTIGTTPGQQETRRTTAQTTTSPTEPRNDRNPKKYTPTAESATTGEILKHPTTNGQTA